MIETDKLFGLIDVYIQLNEEWGIKFYTVPHENKDNQGR